MISQTSKLSLIVPAYNKDSEVFESISSMVYQLKQLDYDWEIIVVDDASKDLTLREAVRSKKFNGNSQRIKIFSYDLNQGKGFALYYGFKKSQGDIIMFIDSDLDLPAENILVILNKFRKSAADIAIGSKRHQLSQVNYPIIRRFQSKIYQVLIKLLFNLDVSDTQVGLKVFRREVIENIFPRIVVKRYAFDLELLVVAKTLGFTKIIESPIVLKYNFTSTISIGSIRQILQDTLAIYYRKNCLKFYETSHYTFAQDTLAIANIKAFV